MRTAMRTIVLSILFALPALLIRPAPAGWIAAAQAAGPAVPEADLEGLEWRMIGPWRGGRATAVAGHPDRPLFFVMGATGGVWITRDGGENWTVASDKDFSTASVGAIEIAPSDPNVIVVGMGESPVRGVASSHGDGVYRSTDGGRSWTHLDGFRDSRHISTVRIHPTNPDIFWVAVQGAAYAATEERGVYKTTDGGKSFRRVLYVDENTGAIDLAYDAGNPRILYAAMWDWQRTPWAIRSGGPGSGIWRSKDGGETWERLAKDLPELMGKIGVAPSPAAPGRVYAVIEAREKGGVYRSDDYGESWTRVNETRQVQARSWYYMHIFADPKDPDTVYVQNSALLKSIDGGKTFDQIAQSIHGDHHDLWINPRDPRIMAGANDGGVAITYDGGKGWTTQHNQPTGQFYRVNTDNAFFYRVYGGQQDNSTVAIRAIAPDGSIGREDYEPVGGCESAHVAFDPDHPRLVYSGCYLGQIEEYDRATFSARDIRVYPELAFGVPAKERRYRFNWNAPILVSQHDPKVIYHAGNVLFRSTDRGQSWTAISPDLTRNETDKQGPGGFPITNEVSENYNTIFYVAESPHDAKTLWVGTDDGLVQLTRDGGATWTNVTPKAAGEGLVNAIEVSPHDPATAYVAFSRYKYNDHTPLVFRTADYGAHWKNIGKALPEGHWVRVVREDPTRRGLLYAGTELGIHVSWNDGRDWQSLAAGEFPVVPVTDLQVHDDDLVAATQGRAFWVLDDIAPVRQMSDDIPGAEAHLFAPAAAVMVRSGGRGGGRHTSPNPPRGAVLYYTLKSAPDLKKTPLEIAILDADGKIVRSLRTSDKKGAEGGGRGVDYALPAKAGLNRAVWDFARDPLPQKLGGFAIASRGGGRIAGATVAPGTYRVRLTLGETTLEAPLEVRFDPRIAYDPADMAEQQTLVGDAMAMLDEFQGSVLALRQVREQAKLRKELAEKAKKEELAKAADAVIKAVDDWEKGNISTERAFFQDVLNWPDRLFSELQMIYGDLDGAQPKVTQGMKDRLADVRGRFADAMAARDAIVAGAIADFNRLFAESGEPGLAVPAFREGG